LALQRSINGDCIFQTPLDYKILYQTCLKQYKRVYDIKVFSYCLLAVSGLFDRSVQKDARHVSEFLTEVNRSFCEFVSSA
jgi:hypothetical protein